ncbi:MAG TPA: hypothetical protein VMM76_02380 [Pirellulaceae bacterium]|nr:hypothetical protein [Pirellulaceae bacterium]
MSFKGHLVCHTCRLTLCLGKLLRNDADQPIGFGHAHLSKVELGSVSLEFIANHIKHDLACIGDDEWDNLEELPEYDMLMQIPPGSPYAMRVDPMTIAGISFWRIPCEPQPDREQRLRSRKA